MSLSVGLGCAARVGWGEAASQPSGVCLVGSQPSYRASGSPVMLLPLIVDSILNPESHLCSVQRAASLLDFSGCELRNNGMREVWQASAHLYVGEEPLLEGWTCSSSEPRVDSPEAGAAGC